MRGMGACWRSQAVSVPSSPPVTWAGDSIHTQWSGGCRVTKLRPALTPGSVEMLKGAQHGCRAKVTGPRERLRPELGVHCHQESLGVEGRRQTQDFTVLSAAA